MVGGLVMAALEKLCHQPSLHLFFFNILAVSVSPLHKRRKKAQYHPRYRDYDLPGPSTCEFLVYLQAHTVYSRSKPPA